MIEHIKRFIKQLFSTPNEISQLRVEKFLAESQSREDLERRLRMLEGPDRNKWV